MSDTSRGLKSMRIWGLAFPASGKPSTTMRTSWVAWVVKNLPTNAGDIRDAGSIPDGEDPLEEEMATHSSHVAWRIPWTEEPGGLQFIGLPRVRYDWSDWARRSTMRTSPGKASQWRRHVERELHSPSQASILAELHVCMRSSGAM